MVDTGYGTRRMKQTLEEIRSLCQKIGFQLDSEWTDGLVFKMRLKKPQP